MALKVLRWIGVVLLPWPVAMIVEIVFNFLLFYTFKCIFWNETVAHRGAMIIANAMLGAIIPLITGIVAPNGKKVAAVVVTSATSVIMLVSTVLAYLQGKLFTCFVNLLSMIACIVTTVYIYKQVSLHEKTSRGDVEVIDVLSERFAFSKKIKTIVATSASTVAGVFKLIFMVIGWLAFLSFLSMVVHLGWQFIGTGFWRSVLGIAILVAAGPKLLLVAFQAVLISVALVPVLCQSIFGRD